MLLHKVCALLVEPSTAARARAKAQLSKLQGKTQLVWGRVCRWLSDITEVHGGDGLSRIAAPFKETKSWSWPLPQQMGQMPLQTNPLSLFPN